MRDEDYLNRLRALSNQQNVPLRVNPAEKPQIPQQYTPTFNQPRIQTAPEPKRQPSPYSFAQQAQSFVTGAGEQLGGGLLRLAFRAVPTAARFTPFGATSYVAGKLGGRDVLAEIQRKGEELAKESERLQAEEIARQPDQAAARRGMQFGSALKGTAEAGLMITPVGAASKIAQGTRLYQAGIKAKPIISLATRIGENIVSGTPATVIGILQEVGRGNKPNVAKEALIGSAIDALIPVVGKGYNALKSPQVRNILTGITDKFTVKGVIKSLDETLPEKAVEDAAESIAKSTNPEEIGRIIDDISVEPVRTAVPEVPSIPTTTAPVSAAISQTVDATARQLAQTSDPTATKLAIDALFPNLDEATRTNLSNTIARTTDPEAVKTSLEQAQKRSDELSATIRQVTPEAPSQIQRQAEAAAKLAEQPPVVEAPVRPVTTAPTVTPTPSTVQGAISTTNIPGTTASNQNRINELIVEAKKYKTFQEFLDSQLETSIETKNRTKWIEEGKKSEPIARKALEDIRTLENKYLNKPNLKLTEKVKSEINNQYNNSVKILTKHLDTYGGFQSKTGWVEGKGEGPSGLMDKFSITQLENIWNQSKEITPAITPIQPTQVTPTPSTVQGAVRPQEIAPTNQPTVSEVLYGTDTPTEEQGLDFIRRISPNRLIRDYVTRPAQDFVNRMFAKAQVSGVAPIRGLGRLGTGISRELGATPELLAARKQFLQGTGEFGKIVREDIVALGKGLSDTVQQRVWATLDPELAAAKGIKVSVADLEPEELAYRNELVKIRDAITQENLDRGLINEEQAAANWFKRGYEVFDFEPVAKTAYQDTKKGLLKQYKGRKDISEELVDAAIEDPSYLLAKKAADSHAVWGMVDYGNWLAANDFVSDVARPGYRQLPTSKIYGEASGKFVPTNIAEDFTGFQFNNAITNAFNDIITAYDNLSIRKAKKAMLTVLNPTVRLGNQLSNRVIFAQLGGINPVTFNKNFMRVKKLREARDPLYLEAVKRGLTGLDMTQKEFTNKIAEYTGQPNLAQRAWEWTKGTYSQADDNARIAAFVTNVERGYSLDEAARLAQRAFQDYKSVGFLYDIAAKTPIVGNAFVRFAGDSARILTNALVDQPLTLAGSLTGLWILGEQMSRMSGETPDEKKTREERFGAPKIPFVNIPLEIQTPWGAVNAARFLPYYNLNEIQGNLTKFLPFAGNPLEAKNWNDPLLGQALQLLVDKDFRGKSIKEPENVGQFRTPTPGEVALENRVRFALTQNVPLGREIDALYSAAKGQEDVYGGERSLGQAIGRLFGVKVEKFGPEQVKKLKENEAFFADKKFIDDQLATMPKDKQETYKKLTGYYKLREQVENTFEKGKMRFKKEPVYAFSEDKYKDLSSNPELYDLLMQQKVRDNQRDGKPIPPEFDTRLSNEFRRQLIENKSLRPGDDAEADERMYSSPEWDTYQTIKQEYKDKAKAFFPQTTGEFNDELVKHQNADFPEKTGAYKEYSDAYALFAKGQGPKPTFTDAVKEGKDKYNQAKLDWTNKERKARGLAPISPEVWNNVTFGFTSDEEKVYNELRFGRGLGGFGFDSTSPEYKAAMAALQQAGITVKPLEIISAAPRRVRLQRQRVPTTRRAARIRLR